ncbi:MAG: class I SAM-dependent methyltransferase [Acidobacteriota bacterium]|nr:class I SAM-dependent methyltransferase [Acidobacteriota bacterium]
MKQLGCRFCGAQLEHVLVDLGMSPLANSFRREDELLDMEPTWPLRVYVCQRCFLVQLPEFASPEHIFSDYAYFSGYSDTWLRHVEAYAGQMCERLELDEASLVIEVASNDGCLLRFFQKRGVPVLGIEPASNVAAAAVADGVPTRVEFFGSACASGLAEEGRTADLLLGNNVLAHVPDLNDFVAGLGIVLGPQGVLTLEFPHLARLIEENQFDTIYHEHFSYLSLGTVKQVLEAQGLRVFDVQELPTHGGSLRVFACHSASGHPAAESVAALEAAEAAAGLDSLDGYRGFGERVAETKRKLLAELVAIRDRGETIVAYGAAAKGNTLLNYCGIGVDFIDYAVDRNPEKQGRFLPGSVIPVRSPEAVLETRPDWLFILPWNLVDEITEQMAVIREWGGRFLTAIPEPRVHL